MHYTIVKDLFPECRNNGLGRAVEAAEERYVYVLGSEIVGYAHLDGAELSCVAIKISRQGGGLGREFVRFLVNRLLEAGHGEPYLYCVVGNNARCLYELLGFQEAACSEYAKKCVGG